MNFSTENIVTNNVTPNKVFEILNNYLLADGFDIVLDLDKSHADRMFDKRTGKEYIDFFSAFASMPLGWNHPKMNNPEFIQHIGKIALNKPSNSDIYTEYFADFVQTFHQIAVPDYFKYSFYVCGGALAVENALKTAFDWKVRQNFRKGYIEEKGLKIIHFKEAFHGRSGYTISLTNTDPTKTNYFPKFDWPRILNPKMRFPMNEENTAIVIEEENQAIAQIKQAFADNKDDIAAIIIEPIQAEGGDNHFRPEFHKALRRICDENEALLIYDEVQTGIGLTGKMWCHQHYDVKPDLLCFGKKMQVCGILAGERIDSEPENVFKVSSRINSTWGGNLVDMIRSAKYLRIIQEENVIANVNEMGQLLIDKMNILQSNYSDIISNVRGKGLFTAFDFKNSDIRDKFRAKCWDNGLIILGCGKSSIRFRSPLNVSTNSIEQGFDIINKVIKDL